MFVLLTCNKIDTPSLASSDVAINTKDDLSSELNNVNHPYDASRGL